MGPQMDPMDPMELDEYIHDREFKITRGLRERVRGQVLTLQTLEGHEQAAIPGA